jgi:hypothetical protein
MTKRQKRFLVEFPDDTTELIIAHPGGHIDVIEVDRGDESDDDDPEGEDPDEVLPTPRRGRGPQGSPGHRR